MGDETESWWRRLRRHIDPVFENSFETGKRASDFVGMITRIAFLAIFREFLNGSLADSAGLKRFAIAVASTFLLLLQMYLQFFVSAIMAKTIRDYFGFGVFARNRVFLVLDAITFFIVLALVMIATFTIGTAVLEFAKLNSQR